MYTGIIQLFFVPAICFLIFLSAVNTTYIEDISEVSFFLTDSILWNVLGITAFVFLSAAILKNRKTRSLIEKINTDESFYHKCRTRLLYVLLSISLFWVLSTQYLPRSDALWVQRYAYLVGIQDGNVFIPGSYIDRYWNQRGIILLNLLFGRIVGFHNVVFYQCLNAVALTASYREITRICELFKWENTISIVVLISGILFFPLIMYCSFVYGIIIGLFFGLLAIRLEIEFFQGQKYRKALLSATAIALAVVWKANYLIFFISMAFYALIKTVMVKKAKNLFMLFFLLTAFVLQSRLPDAILAIEQGKELGRGESYLSWIAMGLQEGDRGAGWYNGFNDRTYKSNGYNTDEQAETAKYDIKESLSAFRNDHKWAAEFFEKKIASEWCDPTFQSFWILQGLDSQLEESDWAYHFRGLSGELFWQPFLNCFCMIVLVGALLFWFLPITKKSCMEVQLLTAAFVGGFIFHIIWEAKAQYTLPYFVLLIPLASCGYYRMECYVLDCFKTGYSYNTPRNSVNKGTLILFLLTAACITAVGLKYDMVWVGSGDDRIKELIERNETDSLLSSGIYSVKLDDEGALGVRIVNDKIIPDLQTEESCPVSIQCYHGNVYIRFHDDMWYLAADKHQNDSYTVFVQTDVENEKPFSGWYLRKADGGLWRILYDRQSLTWDDTIKQLVLQPYDGRPEQLWKIEPYFNVE